MGCIIVMFSSCRSGNFQYWNFLQWNFTSGTYHSGIFLSGIFSVEFSSMELSAHLNEVYLEYRKSMLKA